MKKTINDLIFIVSLVVKGLDGLLELVGSFLLFIIKPQALNSVVSFLTQHELSEDPNDFIATSIVNLTKNYNLSSQHFAEFYLLAHGFIKIFFVIQLLRKHLWAFPLFLIFQASFIVYQIYRISYSHSIILTFLTLFDMLVFWLVWIKYNKLRQKPLVNSG